MATHSPKPTNKVKVLRQAITLPHMSLRAAVSRIRKATRKTLRAAGWPNVESSKGLRGGCSARALTQTIKSSIA